VGRGKPRELVDGPIECDERRSPLIALANDLVEVERLFTGQRTQAEVIDDEQIGAGKPKHLAVVASDPYGPEHTYSAV
jgi:hypothetical protein